MHFLDTLLVDVLDGASSFWLPDPGDQGDIRYAGQDAAVLILYPNL